MEQGEQNSGARVHGCREGGRTALGRGQGAGEQTGRTVFGVEGGCRGTGEDSIGLRGTGVDSIRGRGWEQGPKKVDR